MCWQWNSTVKAQTKKNALHTSFFPSIEREKKRQVYSANPTPMENRCGNLTLKHHPITNFMKWVTLSYNKWHEMSIYGTSQERLNAMHQRAFFNQLSNIMKLRHMQKYTLKFFISICILPHASENIQVRDTCIHRSIPKCLMMR